ncbi:MAG: hypothetical protein RRZ84_03755 [Romboutsia sp.]
MAKETNNNWINEHLRFALASVNNKAENQITKDYLKTLKEVDLSNQGITNLDGIEFAVNLVSINLSKNNIKDASVLRRLKRLTNLELCENKIEDISFLDELVRLNSIGLECNNISYMPNLKNLRNLNLINISNNKINDLSFISSLRSKNIKIIASEQCVLLNPISVHYGEDYTFKPHILWDEDNDVLCDNIQVTGKYNSIETDERPSILYSISKLLIKNICSDCIIKAEFYHEVPFLKSGILSGTLIQPIIVKLSNLSFDINKLKKEKLHGKIYGKLSLEDKNISDNFSYNFIKNRVVTIIDSSGKKISCLTNSNGEYTFSNVEEGRYTLLFPFVNDFEYKTPSLYVCNLTEGDIIEINSIISKN